MRDYHARHADEHRAACRANYLAHRDQRIARQRAYYRAHREQAQAYERERRRRKRVGAPMQCEGVGCLDGHCPTPLSLIEGRAWLCPTCSVTAEWARRVVNVEGPSSPTCQVLVRVRERNDVSRLRPMG